MSRQWTKAQEAAINSKGSTLVAASAGTGKTAVLTERVVKEAVTEGIAIEKMLVVTFSNAAATEMSDRIRNKLFEVMQDKKNTTPRERTNAYEQIKNFPLAKIQTIHSFCNDLVREFFYKIGVDANIAIATPVETKVMKRKAIDKVLDDEYFITDPAFCSLEEYMKGTESFEDMLINCYDKLMSFVSPFDWLDQAIEEYNIPDGEIPTKIKNMMLDDFTQAIKHLDLAISQLEDLKSDKMKKNLDSMKNDREILSMVADKIANGDIDAIDENTFVDFAPTLRFPSGDEYALVKLNRNLSKDQICEDYKKTKFNLQNQIQRIRDMYPIAKKFADIMQKFHEEYRAMKNEKKVIDFNDMEKYAHQILSDDGIAHTVSKRFLRVFVDEYQDTNPIQEAIINKVACYDNLFCVGDMKQSIYRFRSSDPLLFSQRSSDYKSKAKKGKVIALNSNFRSAQNVLDCANDVFYNISNESKEINYTEEDALVHGRNDDGKCNPVIVNVIPEETVAMALNMTADEVEAYNIVATIENVIGTEIYDQEVAEYRKVKYSDIAVLSRKLTGLSDVLSQAFSANGIPYKIDKAGELLSSIEIQILLNVIDVINNPDNDIKLVSIVHEGFFDFTDENMIEIRTYNLKDTFYNNMKALIQFLPEAEVSKRCEKLFNFIDTCKEMEKHYSLTKVVGFIIKELNFYDHFATMDEGDRRVANIKLFCNYASIFEEEYPEKLYGFAKYMRKIGSNNDSIDDAKMNFDDNSVTITTIHKSKGLEYPIVILAYMNKGFSIVDKRSPVIIDKDAGIGFRYYNEDKRAKGKTLLRTYTENLATAKADEEEMRLLYVAMTRAKEQLFIQGINNTVSKSMLNWVMSTLSEKELNANGEVRITGLWKVNSVSCNDFLQYVEQDKKPISNQDFLNQYSGVNRTEEIEEEELPESIPTVISSSQINEGGISFNFNIPNFDENTFSNTEIGTIVHLFMRNIDFKGNVTLEGLKNQLTDMVDNQILTPDEAKQIDLSKIADFFKTEFGQKMVNAEEYIRELPVSVFKTATELGLMEDDNEILIRCVIDLIFVYNGEYYLVDYKTDKIGDESDAIIMAIQKHKKQISIYADAYKAICNKTVQGKYLVFFDIAEAVDVNMYD